MEGAHARIKSAARPLASKLRVDDTDDRFGGWLLSDVLKSSDCDLTVSDVFFLLTGNVIYTPQTRLGLHWDDPKTPGTFMSEHESESFIALAVDVESDETLWRDLAA